MQLIVASVMSQTSSTCHAGGGSVVEVEGGTLGLNAGVINVCFLFEYLLYQTVTFHIRQ